MPIKRVSMASRSLTTFAGRSIWCRSSSGPWRPTHSADGMKAAHLTIAADRPWTCHHSPLSRLANLTHAVAGRLSLSVPTWQHVYRRVLRELDIEFEPRKEWTRQFLRSLQLSWKIAATHTRHRPSEADIARERAAARHLPVRSLQNLTGSHLEPGRDSCAHRSSRRARVDQEGRGSPCLRLARLRHDHARCKHERRHVDTDCL